MDEQAIRQLVRDAVRRHLQAPDVAPGLQPPQTVPDSPLPVAQRTHASHVRFLTLEPGDGSCIVEPAVRCTHCGFCQSYGH